MDLRERRVLLQSQLLAQFHNMQNTLVSPRGERYIETIASLDQWSMTIENHWSQWLKDPKTIEKPLKPMVWGLEII